MITQVDLRKLQDKKLALFTATDVPTARLGLMHAFDSQAELDAYDASYIASARAQVARNQANHVPTPSPSH